MGLDFKCRQGDSQGLALPTDHKASLTSRHLVSLPLSGRTGAYTAKGKDESPRLKTAQGNVMSSLCNGNLHILSSYDISAIVFMSINSQEVVNSLTLLF